MTSSHVSLKEEVSVPKSFVSTESVTKPDFSFQRHIRQILKSSTYQNVIFLIVLINCIELIFETDFTTANDDAFGSIYYPAYRLLDLGFLSIYFIDLVLQVYIDPYKYWLRGYNLLDALVVVIYFAEWVSYLH